MYIFTAINSTSDNPEESSFPTFAIAIIIVVVVLILLVLVAIPAILLYANYHRKIKLQKLLNTVCETTINTFTLVYIILCDGYSVCKIYK